jgi:hypothetical protein
MVSSLFFGQVQFVQHRVFTFYKNSSVSSSHRCPSTFAPCQRAQATRHRKLLHRNGDGSSDMHNESLDVEQAGYKFSDELLLHLYPTAGKSSSLYLDGEVHFYGDLSFFA